MKFTLKLVKRNMVWVFMAVLLVSTTIPQSASADEIQEGYDIVWDHKQNITLYYPPSTGYLQSSDGIANQLQQMENKYTEYAERPVNVYWDSSRELIGVNFEMLWSTNPNAISFADYKEAGNSDGSFSLSATTTNDTTIVADVIPDMTDVEVDVKRSPLVHAGRMTNQLANNTDIDTASSVIVEITNYNYSVAPYLFMYDVKAKNAAPLAVEVLYANSTGHITGQVYQTILNSEFFLYRTDHFVKLPVPVTAGFTYIDKIKFTSLILDRFELRDFTSEYEDHRTSTNYVFDTVGTSLNLNLLGGLLGETASWFAATLDFGVSEPAQDQSGKYTGYEDTEESGIEAAKAAVGEKTDPVDYKVNKGTDFLSLSSLFSGDLFGFLSDSYDDGNDNPQSITDKAKEWFQSSALTSGVSEFGESPNSAIEMFSSMLFGVLGSGGRAVSSVSNNSLFGGLLDPLGHLPNIPTALFNQFKPGLGIADKLSNLKWIALGIGILIAAIIVMRMVKT